MEWRPDGRSDRMIWQIFHCEPLIEQVVNVEESLMPDQFRFDFNAQHGILLSE